MKISSIKIQNFKTFGDQAVTFSCNSLITLIGENSVGKSNVLEALDLFFNFSKTKISLRSFHHDNYLQPIIIEIVFCKLTENEIKIFKSHLGKNDTLTVTQYIKAVSTDEDRELKDVSIDEIDFEESKHGTKLQPKDEFQWAVLNEEKLPTKKNITNWWKTELKIAEFDFKSLFDSESEPSQDIYQEKLRILLETHSENIPQESVVGDEKMLGWKSKLKANLPKYFYIPAIKNVAEDLKVTKTSALGELINWLTSSVSREIKEEFKTKSEGLVKDLLGKIDVDDGGNSKIGIINKALNDNIGFDIGCTLRKDNILNFWRTKNLCK